MKKNFTLIMMVLVIPFIFSAFTTSPPQNLVGGKYVVVAWNDLGMHCSNKDFSKMAILPPYNNQSAHVILQGSTTRPPQIMDPQTSGVHVNFSIPGNTWSGSSLNVTKTNFWTYAYKLFGVNLPPNIGLTGVGLSGTMGGSNGLYHVQGIPITPYTDNNLTRPDPYQLALIQAYDANNQLLASTQSVIPVSNEINCVSSGCHTSEMDILTKHDQMPGFNKNIRPILCANCHADNALGMPGKKEVPSFSEAIHEKHSGLTNDCYKCHPGPQTQCYRDVMHQKGITCQQCHGSVLEVAKSIERGRKPWLQEPSCGSDKCHGPKYAEEPGKLFRESKGHGGLYCSTCHGSPHAIVPTSNPRDNIQNIALQGFAGTLSKCDVCHGYTPSSGGPHNETLKSSEIPDENKLFQNFPNPCSEITTIPYHISTPGFVKMYLLDIRGNQVRTILNQNIDSGKYTIDLNASGLNAGTYICVLDVDGSKSTLKIIVTR
jgi:hypothetical protein